MEKDIEVLPAILEKSFLNIKDKIKRLANITNRVQLDIADGKFVPEETWHNPADLAELGDVKIDLHLMVERPETWIAAWNAANIFRFTFHYEATYDLRRTVAILKRTGKEVAVALNPGTPVSQVRDILREVDMILVLGVEPGSQGRDFIAETVDKVAQLRAFSPSMPIGVDGGVTPMTAPKLIQAGANVLVSGSYIFGQDNIKEAITKLKGVDGSGGA